MPRAESKTVLERRARVGRVLPKLKREYPDARCRLIHESPLQLLVATILSAQCTDDRVNIVTRELFQHYKSASDFAAASSEELEKAIQSTGFFRAKAKSIKAMATALVETHGGQVPDTMEALVELAGVGRKTANVVLGNAFHKNVGVVVDTHVTRLSNRLGLTKHKIDAVKIELDLIDVVPQDEWTLWPHLMIFHGRAVCQARKPRCSQCLLFEDCPSGKKFIKASGG